MTSIPALEQSAVRLLEAIQAEWEHDLAFSAWLGAEGERVRDSALTLVQAVKSGTLRDMLGGMSVQTYLGESWLEVHSKSRGLADDFQVAVSGESDAA
jgi:hypothetical protein